MSVMTNEEITAEFETLFGGAEETPEEETATEETTEEDQTTEEETTEETTEESTETTEDSETDETTEETQEESPVDRRQQQQNYAFAQQRLQIKEHEKFIRGLGKLVGFDDTASISDIEEKIKEALLEKEAKDQNIPIELARRLDRAEELLQENDRIKLEKKVTEDFSDLIERHNLNKEDVDAFTQYLLDNDKNPMEGKEVDLEAEYLKLHFDDMVQAAVQEALAKEDNRQKKVEEQAASAAPDKSADKGEVKISSVKELDDLFNSMDL